MKQYLLKLIYNMALNYVLKQHSLWRQRLYGGPKTGHRLVLTARNLRDVVFDYSDMTGCSFDGARIQHGSFVEADLQHSNLDRAAVRHCSIDRTDFLGTLKNLNNGKLLDSLRVAATVGPDGKMTAVLHQDPNHD